MKLTEDQFVESYKEELKAKNRQAAPQVMVASKQKIWAVPVLVRVLDVEQFHKEIADMEPDEQNSPHEITIAIISSEEDIPVGEMLVQKYADHLARKEFITDVDSIASLLCQLNGLCNTTGSMLMNVGHKLVDFCGAEIPGLLAQEITEETRKREKNHPS